MADWSQAGQGAMGGAAAGAAFGPWGALAGGVIGGAAGLFGDDGKSSYQDQLKQMAAGYQGRGVQAGPAAQGAYSGFRSNQAGLISQLEAMARGEGPSAATMQMREAMDRAAGAQASAAAGAGGRGVNAGAAFRNASNNTAAVQAQGARDTGNMRVQEQLGAINSLGQNISAGRQADENMNQFNATQTNQTNLANLQAKLSMMGLNDQSQLQALMMAMGAAGPGMGTQIMAGGASMAPLAAQYMNGHGAVNPNDPSQFWQGGQRQASMYGNGPYTQGAGGGTPQNGGTTTPDSLFGQYARNGG